MGIAGSERRGAMHGAGVSTSGRLSASQETQDRNPLNHHPGQMPKRKLAR